MKRKIIFSCDTGIDDALALAYLAAQDECQVIGVTVSYGMGKVEESVPSILHFDELPESVSSLLSE